MWKVYSFANISTNDSRATQCWLSLCIAIGLALFRRMKSTSHYCASVQWNAGRKQNGLDFTFFFKKLQSTVSKSCTIGLMGFPSPDFNWIDNGPAELNRIRGESNRWEIKYPQDDTEYR